MRYIKLYEEFRHDEIHDVMMSICDTVSFKESERFPSTDRVRLYETSELVEFDPKQYEEYLEGWKIFHQEDKITFVKGDLKEAGLSWLNEIYGNLKPVNIKIKNLDSEYYVDDDRKPLFFYFKNEQESKNGYYYINSDRIWSFFSRDIGYKHTEIEGIIKEWLGSTYNLRGLTPLPRATNRPYGWDQPII